MRIAVWKTGHAIADTVADALREGFDGEIKDTRFDAPNSGEYGAHIAYGILRGTSDIFKANPSYFNVDRGYFTPGHFDGYYRISYRGTQAKYDAAYPINSTYRVDLLKCRVGLIGNYILICPPTEPVCAFYEINYNSWVDWAIAESKKTGLYYIKRSKGDTGNASDFLDGAAAVITFNSSLGWQALINGIPCLSDPQHSVVGSYYNTKSIDELLEMVNNVPRKPLLDFMASHQFTLDEIRRGDAWPLIKFYLSKSSSDMMAGKRLQAMSQPTASSAALKNHFQSVT